MLRFLSALLLTLSVVPQSSAQDMPLSEIIKPGEGFKKIDSLFGLIGGMATDSKGEVYVSDAKNMTVRRIDHQNEPHPFADTGFPTFGIAFSTADVLYGTQPEKGRIVRYSADGAESPFAEGLKESLHIAFSPKGALYAVDAKHSDKGAAVVAVSAEGKLSATPFPKGEKLAGLVFWNEGTFVALASEADRFLLAARVEADGSTGTYDRYYALRTRPSEKGCATSALTTDDRGRMYAATSLGIQVFDPTGRLCGVLPNPSPGKKITALAFGGAARDRLLIACENEVWHRQMLAKGASAAPKK